MTYQNTDTSIVYLALYFIIFFCKNFCKMNHKYNVAVLCFKTTVKCCTFFVTFSPMTFCPFTSTMWWSISNPFLAADESLTIAVILFSLNTNPTVPTLSFCSVIVRSNGLKHTPQQYELSDYTENMPLSLLSTVSTFPELLHVRLKVFHRLNGFPVAINSVKALKEYRKTLYTTTIQQ